MKIRSACQFAIVSATLLFGIASQVNAETYKYIGNPFAFFQSPLESATSVSGTMTLSEALAPNLVDFNAIFILTELEWTDGVRIFTFPDGGLTTGGITVATDGSGNIIRWNVFFGLEQGNVIVTCNDPFGVYLECGIFPLLTGTTTATGDLTQVPGGGLFPTTFNFDNPGTWTLLAEPLPAPMLSPVAITLLGTLLGAVGIRRLSS